MNTPIQNEIEIQRLKCEKSSGPIERTEANEETSISMKDPDRMLSMIVLLLACVALAILADVFIWVAG